MGKEKVKNNNLPNIIRTDDNREIFDKKEIAENFNNYYTNIGPKLASKIPATGKDFKSYLPENKHVITFHELTFEEFDSAYKALQRNKSLGVDDIKGSIILDVYNEIRAPLFEVFRHSLKDGIFPDRLKIARITPIFKSGDNSLISNYRPISVLPAFSKILERIMHNRLFSYFKDNKLLFSKQFGFQRKQEAHCSALMFPHEKM